MTPTQMRNVGIGVIIGAVLLGFVDVADGYVDCGDSFNPIDRGPYKCKGMDWRRAVVIVAIVGGLITAIWGVSQQAEESKKAAEKTQRADPQPQRNFEKPKPPAALLAKRAPPTCSACEEELSPGARFCGHCGVRRELGG